MLPNKSVFLFLILCSTVFASTTPIVNTPTNQSAQISSDDTNLTLPQSFTTASTQAQQTFVQNHEPPSPATPLYYTCASGDNFCATQQNNWTTFLQQYDSGNNPAVAILSNANTGGSSGGVAGGSSGTGSSSGSSGGAGGSSGGSGSSGGTSSDSGSSGGYQMGF